MADAIDMGYANLCPKANNFHSALPPFIDALVFAIDTLWLWEEKEVS